MFVYRRRAGAAAGHRRLSSVSAGVVHRCQLHKLRNELGHLPERLHGSVGEALRGASGPRFQGRARRGRWRDWRGRGSATTHSAAASIRDGLEETLTVKRLGLTGTLADYAAYDEIIWNLMGSVESYTRRGQAVARRPDDSTLGGERAGGGGTGFPRVRGCCEQRHFVRGTGRAGSAGAIAGAA